MRRFVVRALRASGSTGRVLALVAAAAALPVAAQASTITETFQWVPGTPTVENPTSAQTTTAGGTLTLTLSGFSLQPSPSPGNPNFGPYYASPSNAVTTDITGLSYTFGNGVTVDQTNLTSATVGTTPWTTSSIATPAGGPGATPGPGYYLNSVFNLFGSVGGVNFQIGNAAGQGPGGTYPQDIGNGTNNYNGSASHPAIADGGYWKLETAAPVPLPPGLGLLLSGLGLMAWLVRRSGSGSLQAC